MQRKSLATILTCAILALGTLALTAADVSGKWSWTMGRPGGGGGGGQARKMTADFKAEGAKLTGKVTMPGRQGGDPVSTEISNGKVSGSDISFEVTREFNGNKFTSKYSGKVEGDTIKGKIESERNGQTNSRDWEAKREK